MGDKQEATAKLRQALAKLQLARKLADQPGSSDQAREVVRVAERDIDKALSELEQPELSRRQRQRGG